MASLFSGLFGDWYKNIKLIGLLKLRRIRDGYRKNNLHNTEPVALPTGQDGWSKYPDPGSLTKEKRKWRTPDGTFNDLAQPSMGRAGTRFGRNVPLSNATPNEATMLTPSPREVANVLMQRDKFLPATSLNLLAAAWIQFQLHDWISHGPNRRDREIEIPLTEGDAWPGSRMQVRRTRLDPTRTDTSTSPPTFSNTATHWWDGSQLYGSNAATQQMIRSGQEGKIRLDAQGFLPLDDEQNEITGVNGNWWLGLSLMHTLFAREHNQICDQLRAQFPAWSDEELFNQARLINAALMAKIHTIEWTPGILPNKVIAAGMNENWSMIRRSKPDHHAAPYAMTEEFTAVYRMHPLLPEKISFRSLQTGRLLDERLLQDVVDQNVRQIMNAISLEDLFYSFGVAHPGAITLHNFPNFLRQLRRGDTLIDLATVDILRDRERGVPRYNEFRKLFDMPPIERFEDLTKNPNWAEEIRRVYKDDINSVDLMVGLYAEPLPEGFGFSETAFRVFLLMASRRLQSDRFFTSDYNEATYTKLGLDWIEQNNMRTVLMRHFPALTPLLRNSTNAFAPWG